MRPPLAAIVSLATVMTVSPALAQGAGSRQTREFVQAAAQSDQFEIMEATTALAQSRDPDVRAFAQQMIEAHRQTAEQLRQATSSAGLAPPPPGMGGDRSAFLAALQSQRGPDFDRTYIKQQALAHGAALVVERSYAAMGDDPTVRRTAAATVPTIEAHLERIEDIAARLGGG